MLNKQYRLTKNRDFKKVSQKGHVIYTKELILKWAKNNLDYSRFGIVVSLKVSKKAVIRNKIKRRIRAILREDLLKVKTGYDIIIITKSEIKELEYQDIREKLEYIFIKGKLIMK